MVVEVPTLVGREVVSGWVLFDDGMAWLNELNFLRNNDKNLNFMHCLIWLNTCNKPEF